MTKTTNYQLPKWEKTDRIQMKDFNDMTATLDAALKANADAIRLLNEAMPSDKVLAIRSLEALAKVANGKATKIIIPSELQNLGGVVPSIKELMTDPKDAE